jgi:hypothetical protein
MGRKRRQTTLLSDLQLEEEELIDTELARVLGQRLSLTKYTKRARDVLLSAAELASSRGHDYVGTEHLLLALLADDGGVAAAAMTRLDIRERLRAEVVAIVESEAYRTPATQANETAPLD